MTSRLFWPLILIAAGVLLLLDNLNLLPGSAWGWIWPLALIALGVSVLLGGRAAAEPVEDSLALDGARRARLSLKHGAGELDVRGGAPPDTLFAGTFHGGVDKQVGRQGDEVEATLAARGEEWLNWIGPRGRGGRLDWAVRLNPGLPLALSLESGASAATLDLADLKVTEFALQTGASQTRLVLPANAGHTRARINAGAAEVQVRVPEGVAARIRGHMAVGSLDVDQGRFPRRDGGYESPGFETAANRVEIDVEGGVGTVNVR
jgi:hypothetical protein